MHRAIFYIFLILSHYSFAQSIPSMKLPVSELHVHADAGIINQPMFEYLVRKNHLNMDSSKVYKNGIIVHKRGDFFDFLRVYDQVTSVIKTEDDLTEVIYDYLRRSAQHGAIYTELSISPEHYNIATKIYTKPSSSGHKQAAIRSVGFTYPKTIAAVAKGIDKAHRDFGIDARIIIVILRHEGVEVANKLLDNIISHPHPYVRGIGLAGDDVNYPAEMFKDIYARAKKYNLKLTAHMGEHTGPSDIMMAINMKLDRIGHGLSVVDNPRVLEKFKASGIGIESCPSSNIDNGYGRFNTMAKHPLKKMLANHLPVALSTDDPSFDPTNIEHEYLMVQRAYHLSDRQMIELCENSIKMSFAEDSLKENLLKKIERYKRLNHIK